MSTLEEECPICRDKIKNPSRPSQCCNKIICQTCLGQSLRYRAHCPYCRTPVNDSQRPATDSRRIWRPILFGNAEPFNVARPVGSNILNLLQQLQAAQEAQTNTVNQVDIPNQNGPEPSPQSQAPPLSIATRAIFPPVPAPRVRRPAGLLITSIRVLNAAPAPPPPVEQQEYPEEDFDEFMWQGDTTQTQMRQGEQNLGSTLRTVVCPYCQFGGLDALALRDHCNALHANDNRRVVCPVCVLLPHGDPQMYSRNFIGHLNLRHCYYIEDITNVHQNDDVNFQCALMASCNENIH